MSTLRFHLEEKEEKKIKPFQIILQVIALEVIRISLYS